MTTQSWQGSQQRPNPILNDLRTTVPDETAASDTVSPDVEERLWDYALGLLEPDEERQVFRWLAGSPRAEDTLFRIRQAMAQAGVANPIEAEEADEVVESVQTVVLRRVGQRFRSLLGLLSDELAAAAAIVVNLGDGLVGAMGTVGAAEHEMLETPAAVMLDGKTSEPAAPTQGSGVFRIDIPPVAGLAATVIFVAADRTDILVTTSDPPVEGRVRLVRLIESAGKLVEEDTGITAYLRGPEPARLEECPTGMFKIIAPDGRELVVCLGEQP